MSTIYTTVQGDTWDSVAFKFYKNEAYADILMKANPGLIEIFVFDAGTELMVPGAAQVEAERIRRDYPEWLTAETSEAEVYE